MTNNYKPSCERLDNLSRVTIVEAAELLSNFDSSLRNYAVNKLKKQGVQVIEKVGCSPPPIPPCISESHQENQNDRDVL